MAAVVKSYKPLSSPAGPIKNVVPEFFHQFIPEELLECYVISKEEDSRNIPEGSSVITKEFTSTIYKRIATNLTATGRFASMKIHPWIFNTLVDHGDFDHIVCSDPIQTDDIQSFNHGQLQEPESGGQGTCTSSSSEPAGSSSHEQNEMASNENSFYHWSHDATKLFISLLQENQDKLLMPGTKKKGLWVELSKNMKENGYTVTPDQCKNKWTALKSNFKRIEDHNKISGNDNKTYKFYDELHELLGGKPNINPLKVISTTKASKEVHVSAVLTTKKTEHGGNAATPTEENAATPTEENDATPTEENAATLAEENEEPMPKKSKLKKRRSDTSENLVALLKTIKEDAQKEREERMKREDERNAERKEFYTGMFSLLKTLVEKSN